MFVLHSLFQIDEYFIQMNNKYAFFLPDDVSTLVFTATQAFSVLTSLSHSTALSPFPKLFGGLRNVFFYSPSLCTQYFHLKPKKQPVIMQEVFLSSYSFTKPLSCEFTSKPPTRHRLIPGLMAFLGTCYSTPRSIHTIHSHRKDF